MCEIILPCITILIGLIMMNLNNINNTKGIILNMELYGHNMKGMYTIPYSNLTT